MESEDISNSRATFDVVIVNWNSGDHLKRCVAALSQVAELQDPDARIVIVDNGSHDGSCDLDMPDGLRVTVLTNTRNVGFATACNQGAALGRARLVLFLNPDVELESGTLSGLGNWLADGADARTGILGVQLVDAEEQVQRSCARFPSAARIIGQALGLDRIAPRIVQRHFMTEWAHDKTRVVDQVIGAFMVMRRRDFERLGGFDERFFVYMEDVDLSVRARELGLDSLYVHDRRARHWGGGTTRAIPDIRLAYLMRSRILYARKHFGRLSAGLVVAATLFIEPGVRVVRALVCGRLSEAKACLRALRFCWQRYPFGRKDQRGEIKTGD